MKFKQAQKKKCVVFGRFFWVAELEGQERFNYTKYLRHPIHLFALLCLLASSLASLFCLLPLYSVQNKFTNPNTIIMAEIYILVCPRRMSPKKCSYK
jgi:hypothetical protein